MILMHLIATGVALATAPAAAVLREAPAPAPVVTKAKRPTRYCIEYFVTGTRIAKYDCRSRAEWIEKGFDPLAGK